jgi:hypothetical protein
MTPREKKIREVWIKVARKATPATPQESLPVEAAAKFVMEPDEEAGKWDYYLDDDDEDA